MHCSYCYYYSERGEGLAKSPTHTHTKQRKETAESSPEPTSWFHLFSYKRFHVLLNSLFKVLCNFPSRYLFAIGFAVIFSLRWSLPPTLGCTLKQPDSSVERFARKAFTAMGLAPTLEVTGQGNLQWKSYSATSLYKRRIDLCHLKHKSLALSSSLFARRYSGNPFWFLFLRLVICLN